MRFFTFAALAGLAGCLSALPLVGTAAPAWATTDGPPGLVRKREGVAVPSPNRTPSGQLANPAGAPGVTPPGRETDGLLLVDRMGRPLGKPHPGFITNETLVAARINGQPAVIAGLAPDSQCDGTRCRHHEGLVWGTNAAMMLLYASTDCSGRPEVSYHPSAAGFELVAFAVSEPDGGRFMYVARNAPRDAWVRSWRNTNEVVCTREDQPYIDSTLPLEGVYPVEAFGRPPLRWR